MDSLLSNPTAQADLVQFTAPKKPNTAQAAVQEIRLGDSEFTAFVYRHNTGSQQLTLVVSEITFKRLSSQITNGTSNRDLISLLTMIEPELVNHLVGRIRSAFTYPALKASHFERKQIQCSARQLRVLLRPGSVAVPVNFAVEVATPNFAESFIITKTDSRAIAKLQSELENLRVSYEKRRAINPALPPIDFAQVGESIKIAFTKAANGRALKNIAKDLKIPQASLRKWFAGQLVLPEELTGTKVSVKKCFKYLVDLSRLTPKEMAFLTGAYIACNVGRTRIGSSIELTLGEKTTQELAEIVSKSLTSGLKPTTLKRESSYVCRVSSIHFIEQMEELTEKGTRIPWQCLPTATERTEFLRGYCARGHIISTSGVSFDRYGKEELLVELALLLSRFGIIPRLVGNPVRGLVLADRNSLQHFKELQVLSEANDIAILNQVSKSRNNVSSYSFDDYFSVLTQPNSEAKQVDYRTVLNWRENGVKPKAATRKERLDAAVALYKIPNPETQAYLVRSVGIDPKIARPIAYQMKQADLVDRVVRLANCGLNAARNTQALLIPRIVFEESLKFYERNVLRVSELKATVDICYPASQNIARFEQIRKFAERKGIATADTKEMLQKLVTDYLLPI